MYVNLENASGNKGKKTILNCKRICILRHRDATLLTVGLPAVSQGRNVITSALSLFVFQQGIVGPPGENGAPGPIGLLVSIFLFERLFRAKRIVSNISV